MKKFTLFILTLLGLVFSMLSLTIAMPAAVHAQGPCTTDCYVDAVNGDDANDGASWSDAKKTIQAAAGQVNAGGNVFVAAGIYTENIVITRSMTISGTGAGATIVDGDGIGGSTTRRVFYINSGLTVNLNDMTIQHGHAEGSANGGGIYNLGILTIANSAVADNYAGTGTNNVGYGGGIYNNGGALVVATSIISGNYAGHRGGGIANENGGTLSVTDSAFANNESQWGGGIVLPSASATAIITNCTFTGNQANERGGGINVFRGEATIINSTFSANTGVRGAGLSSGDRLTIVNSTITTNTTTNGSSGSVYHYGGALVLTNSIVANNHGGGNCAGTITDGGNNLEDADDCNFSQSSSLTNTNPLLDPLADNGGSTWTHALQAGSPALDAGDDGSCPATDQRGVVRPLDGDGNNAANCDIGAFEIGGDLTIVKSVTSASAAPGDIITYTLTYSNAGDAKVTNIVVTDSIPVSLTNVNVISSGAVITPRVGSNYAWDVADLTKGAGGIITITGVLSNPLAAGTFTNTASITTTTIIGTGVVEWDLAKQTNRHNIPQDYIKHTQEEKKCL